MATNDNVIKCFLKNIYIETVKLSDVWKERNNSKR